MSAVATARDEFGNAILTYEGEDRAMFALRGPPVIVGRLTFTGGVATIEQRLTAAGEYELTVFDSRDGYHSGSLPGIQVKPAAAAKFDISAFPSTPVAGEPLGPFAVRVVDEFDNLVSDFNGQAELALGDSQVVVFNVVGGQGEIPVQPGGIALSGSVEPGIRDTQARFEATRLPEVFVLPRRNRLGRIWAAVGNVTVRPAYDESAFAPFAGEIGDHVLHVIAAPDLSLTTRAGEVDELGNPLSIEGGAAVPGGDVMFQLLGDGVAMPAPLGFVSQETPTRALWNGGKHDGRDVIAGADVEAVPFRAYREVAGGGEPEEIVVTFVGGWRAHIYRLLAITIERQASAGNPRALDEVTTPMSVSWPLKEALVCSPGETVALRAHSNEAGPPYGLLVPGTVAAETSWSLRTPAGIVVRDLARGATEFRTAGLAPGRYQVAARLCDEDESFVVDLFVVEPFLRVSLDDAPYDPERSGTVEFEVCDMKRARGELVYAGADNQRFTADDVLLRLAPMTATIQTPGGEDILRIAPKLEGKGVGVLGRRPGEASVRFTADGDPDVAPVDVPVSRSRLL